MGTWVFCSYCNLVLIIKAGSGSSNSWTNVQRVCCLLPVETVYIAHPHTHPHPAPPSYCANWTKYLCIIRDVLLFDPSTIFRKAIIYLDLSRLCISGMFINTETYIQVITCFNLIEENILQLGEIVHVFVFLLKRVFGNGALSCQDSFCLCLLWWIILTLLISAVFFVGLFSKH